MFSALILFTLVMEALSSSEMSVLRRATRRHIQEDDMLNVLVFGILCSVLLYGLDVN
jgi:hypothetical protein